MKDRVINFDIINIVSCFAVIMMHHSGIVHHYNGSNLWFLSLAVECICYFAVPCFFMLTGATLFRYDERYSTAEFFRKRIKRTIVPFLIWSFIWLILCLIIGDIKVGELTIVGIIEGIINTKYQPVYWFFIPLFMIYLIMPLLSKAKDDIRLIKYLIIVLFVLSPCVSLFCKIGGIEENPFISNRIFGPLFYVLCGYYISRCKIIKNKLRGG